MNTKRPKRTPAEWAQRLVEDVSTVTQLDYERDELANVDDWRRCAENIIRQALEAADAQR